jgi:hypothetical protein
MKNVTCLEDVRELARRKVPRAFFDYAEPGSYSEQTLRANRRDLPLPREVADFDARECRCAGSARAVGSAAKEKQTTQHAQMRRHMQSANERRHAPLPARR